MLQDPLSRSTQGAFKRTFAGEVRIALVVDIELGLTDPTDRDPIPLYWKVEIK